MGNQVSYDEVDSILVESWGGSGGSKWNYKLRGPIKEILINHGEVIDSIMFRTINNDQGDTIDSPRFGGNGGRTSKVVIEDAPLEYLTGIKGTYGYFGRDLVVKSLSFTTNAKSYGPIGKEAGGTPFSFVMEDGGAIVGFHGSSVIFLDAIGVYVQKLRNPYSSPPKEDGKKVEPNAELPMARRSLGSRQHPACGLRLGVKVVAILVVVKERLSQAGGLDCRTVGLDAKAVIERVLGAKKMDIMKTIIPRSAGPWGGCSGPNNGIHELFE
ncbi:hypothetical protein HAX54_023591 [Datura stramonium]|uniref:Jacalin-type lectin domain-containing protein n=1 Tax=Datura stramonium TaxID=4076 RepID=A0ABS8UWT2_DATST|nr:hypothetical protein [Datura stramonium]